MAHLYKHHQDELILNATTNIHRRVWMKNKFQAYMGLMDNKLPRLMESSEISTTITQGSDLIVGVAIEEINKWI